MTELYTPITTAKESKQPMITSLDVAEMVGKEHRHVLRDIRKISNELDKSHIQSSSYFTESTYKDKLNRSYPMFLLTKEGCDLYGKRLTGSNNVKFYEALNTIIGSESTFVVIQPDRLEVTFFTHLSESLKPFGITFETQYPVLNYKLDAYIESLNIAIEYDEEGHEYKKDKDSEREKEIQAVLGCRFIRVSTKQSHAYNIGKVIKGILG